MKLKRMVMTITTIMTSTKIQGTITETIIIMMKITADLLIIMITTKNKKLITILHISIMTNRLYMTTMRNLVINMATDMDMVTELLIK